MMYNDDTPMPWGKHKDKPLRDVDAGYLLWLGETIRDKHVTKRNFTEKELLKYIDENANVLKKEGGKNDN